MIYVIKQLFLKVNQNKSTKAQKLEQKYGAVVEENEFANRDIDDVKCVLNDTSKDRRIKNFLSFEFR